MAKSPIDNIVNKKCECPEDVINMSSGNSIIDIPASKCRPPQEVIINYGDGTVRDVGNIIQGDNIILSGDLIGRLVGLGDVVIEAVTPDLTNYIQQGDNISLLSNDIGYITLSDIPPVDLSNYYTKTELQTSGQAQVHWDNITNVPDLSVLWENIGGDQSSVEVGGFSNTIGYITGVSWGDITGNQSVIGNAGFTNDAGYITLGDLPSPLTFANGLREDGGVVKLGLDLTTIGTTNKGSLTERTVLSIGDIINQTYSALDLDNNRFSLQVINGLNNGGILYNPSGNNELVVTRASSQTLEFSDNGILFTDSQQKKGAGDIADYSANKTAFSYVTKMMLDAVESQIPDLPGFGLSWNSDTNKIDWGTELAAGLRGVIIPDEEVLFMGKIGGFMSNLGSITTIGSANGGIGLTTTITGVIQHGFSFYNAPNGGYTGDTPPVVFTDSLGIGGLHYESDYSANYTNRSLVDKEYVDNLIPDLTGYATEAWVISQGYLTSVSSSWDINTGDLTIQGNNHNLDGRYMLRSNTITSGYGITASGDFTNPVNIEVDTDILDDRYLRKDTDDSNGSNILNTGYFTNTIAATFNGGIYMPFLPEGDISNQMVVYDASDERLKYINMPSFGGTFNIANNAGVTQFSVDSGDSLRINATGDASVSFNAGTKTITINSSGGSTGGGVDSWNARTGAVVPEAGDYTTAQVTESGNLYFTQARVRSTPLTGFTTTNTAIVDTDNILQALGKAQGQINSLVPTSRQLTINGTAGNITVSGGTQSLAANRTWTINLATVGTAGANKTKVTTDAYGRVTGSAALTMSDLPSGVVQTLSLGASAGNLVISGGNNVGLTSLSRGQLATTDRDAWFDGLPVNGGGFFSYSTGSSGFVGSTGQGIWSKRSKDTNNGSFILFTAGNGVSELYYNAGSGSTFGPIKTVADRDWVTSQIPTIPTNYVTTNTSQTGLSGNKSWTGNHVIQGPNGLTVAPTGNTSSYGTRAFFAGANANGPFIVLTSQLSNTVTAVLRGYASSGVQLELNEGGINLANGNLYYQGGTVLAASANTVLSTPGATVGAVYLRPGGSGASTGQAIFTPTDVTLSALTGTGTQMVVANASGVLSRQNIPDVSGYLPLTGGTLTGDLRINTYLSIQRRTNGYIFEISGTGYSPYNRIELGRTDGSTLIRVNSLSGSGNRMVVANANGDLSTQAIPAVGVTSITAGTHLSGGTITSTGTLSVQFQSNSYVVDNQSNPRLYFGNSSSSIGFMARASAASQTFQFRNSDNSIIWQVDNTGVLTTGTVPWGNLSGYVSITAGNGLSGGGALSASRTITLGTPGTITGSSTNSVSTSSHTHALTLVSGDITGALGFTPVTTARTITLTGGTGITSSAGAQNLSANRTWTISLTDIAAGNSSVGALRYNGTTRSNGKLYGGSTDPNSTTRLNYNGILHAYDFVGYGTSDRRLKENIVPIVNPLEKLSQIGGYSFKWKDGHDSYSGDDYGVIAQEVEKVLPEIVSERGGVKAIKTGNQLTGLLIAGFNELVKRVEALENGIS